MKDKKLISNAIIPVHLYVNRDADRQIREIIDSMGRPGYILVSRQMGKTNLLLNAKRELESADLIFSYVDMSRHYQSATECFRNIVDTILKAGGDYFRDSKNQIQDQRNKNTSSPQIEHDNELLIILNNYQGRLVIVLDEIDALTNAEFSDQVFAQIRSTYFSRITYDEFNRLTYILSGVVEPTNIIKDKNKSPFNIGVKIYLDDFDSDEYRKLVNKIEIDLSNEVIDRIFYWANGHPRMTWDICSAVEDYFNDSGRITSDNVDEIVSKLYLQNYDMAPIDNIRELAQSSFEIRSAIRKIFVGNAVLSDSMKNKLYLAGIIKYGNDNIKIKNNIIKHALSEKWLDSIDISNKTLIAVASEHVTLGNYQDAIKCFVKYLSTNDKLSQDRINVVNDRIADCYMNIQKYNDSFEYYNKCKYDVKTQPTEYYANEYYKADALYLNQDFEKAKPYFKLVIDNSQLNKAKCYSYFKYASILVKSDFGNNADEAIMVSKQLIDEVELQPNDSELVEYKYTSYLNLASIYEQMNHNDVAVDMYKKALQTSLHQFKPFILLKLYLHENDILVKEKNIENAVTVIIENNLKFSSDTYKPLYAESINAIMVSTPILKEIIFACYELERKDLICKITDYSVQNILVGDNSLYLLLKELSQAALLTGKYKARLLILMQMLDCCSDCCDTKDQLAHVYRDIGITYYYLKQNYIDTLIIYIDIVMETDLSTYRLNDDDMSAFILAAVEYRDLNIFDKSTEILLKLEKLLKAQLEQNYTNIVILYYHLAQTYDKAKDKFNARKYSTEGLNALKNEPIAPSSLINIKQIDTIRFNLEIINSRNVIMHPYINDTKIGRNDKCFCGSGLKYKRCHGK